MNKFKPVLIFYGVAFAVIYILNWLSPGQQDGGLGFGSLAILLFVLVVFILLCYNLYKGIRQGNQYFFIAGIHLLVLLVVVGKLFL